MSAVFYFETLTAIWPGRASLQDRKQLLCAINVMFLRSVRNEKNGSAI